MPVHDQSQTRYHAQIEKLQTWWRDGIPLVSAMEAVIASLDDDGLVLEAPLAANRNHMGTGFGGSLQALATLAGWGITIMSVPGDVAADVVIRRADMVFFKPVAGPLRAQCPWPAPQARDLFCESLARKRRARLDVLVTLPGENGPVAQCEARFVAIRNVD